MPSAISTRAGTAKCALHHVGGGCLGQSKLLPPEHPQTDVIHSQVKGHHPGDAQYQPTRKISPWVANLAAHESCGMRAAVGEEDRDHGSNKRGDLPSVACVRRIRDRVKLLVGAIEEVRGPNPIHEQQPADDKHGDRQDFKDHENVLSSAAGADPGAIEQRQSTDGHCGDGRFGERPAHKGSHGIDEGLTIAAAAQPLANICMISRKYLAKITATAAIPPDCTTQSSDQP